MTRAARGQGSRCSSHEPGRPSARARHYWHSSAVAALDEKDPQLSLLKADHRVALLGLVVESASVDDGSRVGRRKAVRR